MTLAIRKQQATRLRNGGAMTDRGQRVLQAPSTAHMHVDIAAGDSGNPMLIAERELLRKSLRITCTAMQLDRQPEPIRKLFAQPLRIGGRGLRIGQP